MPKRLCAMRKHHLGEDDLLEELRLNGVENPNEAEDRPTRNEVGK